MTSLSTSGLAAADPGSTIARTAVEVEGLRSDLEALPWTRLDPVPDYYLTVVRERPEVVRPHVLLSATDQTRAFVGRVEDLPLATTMGYRTIYGPTVRAIMLAHGGVIGAETREGADAIVEHLRGALAAGEADVVLLPKLRVDSALYQAAGRLRFPLRQPSAQASLHWALQLPPSFDEFLRSRSKKTRDNVKRYGNRLRRDFDVTLEVYQDPAAADTIFRDAGAVAAKTYQHGLGVAFADSPLDRALTQLGLDRGWFRVYVLYIGGEPAAFWPGAIWNGTFFSGTPGYDTRYSEYGIGKYVLMRVIEDLCSEVGVDRLDYGSGDADYKRQFGSESWTEADVVLFAKRLRPLRINLTKTALEAGVRGAKAAVTRAGLAAKLRRRLRARVASKG